MHTYTYMPLPSVNLLHRTEFKSPDKILKLMVNTTRSNQGHTMMLHTYNPQLQPMSLPNINLLHLLVQRYSLDKILWVKVTTARSKVKSRPHHNIAHLQHLTNFPTKYQLPTPYGFRDIVQTRFSNSRSLLQGQISKQGHTMTLHTYTP